MRFENDYEFLLAHIFFKEILPPPLVNQTENLAMQFLTSSLGSKLSRLPFPFNVSFRSLPKLSTGVDRPVDKSTVPLGLGLGHLSAVTRG